MKRIALFAALAGAFAGLVSMTLARFSRATGAPGALAAALLAGAALAGLTRARISARRAHPLGFEHTLGALALALAVGRPLWEHLPGWSAALAASMPTHFERLLAAALGLTPLVALPAYLLGAALGAALMRLRPLALRAQAALLGGVLLPAGGFGAWLLVATLGPRRALGLEALVAAAVALGAARGPRRELVAAATAVVLLVWLA
jgi:hypothetical protein